MRRWSLEQLTLSVGIAALLVLFLPTAAYLILSVSGETERTLAERGQGIAMANARGVADAMLRGDRLILQEILREMARADPEIRYVCVRDADGAVRGHTFVGEPSAQILTLWKSGRRVARLRTREGPWLDVAAPVLSGQMGTIHVGLSRAGAVQAGRRAMWMAGLSFAAALGVAFAGAVAVAAKVGRPLQVLESTVSRLPANGGNGGPPLETPLRGTREVESLSRSFHGMVARLDLLERERAATRERMVHAERLAALGELSAGLAHEIHNPLDGMLECVRYIEADPGKGVRAGKYLPMIRDGLTRIASTMHSMLAFARSGHGTAAKHCDVGEVIDAIDPMVRQKLKARNVTLIRSGSAACACLCNREGLSQAVLNLVLNAIEAAGDGANPEVRIEVESDGSQIHIAVEDSGPGVPEALRDKIFQPFFTTKPGKGTGLGLPISRNLMHGFGGDLKLERSPPGRLGGARFVISLPRAPEEGGCP